MNLDLIKVIYVKINLFTFLHPNNKIYSFVSFLFIIASLFFLVLNMIHCDPVGGMKEITREHFS